MYVVEDNNQECFKASSQLDILSSGSVDKSFWHKSRAPGICVHGDDSQSIFEWPNLDATFLLRGLPASSSS